MKRISFALTKDSFLDGSKTVTRRLGWKDLDTGTRLKAVEKGMGIPKGEKQVELGEIVVVSVRREPLNLITPSDVVREGFTDMLTHEFISMFCKHMGCNPSDTVTRIEFRKISAGA